MKKKEIAGLNGKTLFQMEDESFLPKSNKSRKALFLCQKIIASNRINFKERGIRIDLISIRLKSKDHGVFQMTTITAKNTKAEILAEALPLIDDQAEKIQRSI